MSLLIASIIYYLLFRSEKERRMLERIERHTDTEGEGETCGNIYRIPRAKETAGCPV